MQEKYEEAEALFGRAVAILEGAVGSDHAKVAVVLCRQANVMVTQVSETYPPAPVAPPLYPNPLRTEIFKRGDNSHNRVSAQLLVRRSSCRCSQ